MGELGSDRPRPKYDVERRVVIVSLRRRLIERIDWLSARSKERKDLPASVCRRGTSVRNMALSLKLSADERTAAWKLTLAVCTVIGRLSWTSFLCLARLTEGEDERDEDGELRPERRPDVKRGEYCANAEESIAAVVKVGGRGRGSGWRGRAGRVYYMALHAVDALQDAPGFFPRPSSEPHTAGSARDRGRLAIRICHTLRRSTTLNENNDVSFSHFSSLPWRGCVDISFP